MPVRPNEAFVDSGLAVQGPSYRPQGDKLRLGEPSSGAPRDLDSRDSGSTREQLHGPTEAGMFHVVVGKAESDLGIHSLQKETWQEVEDRKTQERDQSLWEDRFPVYTK